MVAGVEHQSNYSIYEEATEVPFAVQSETATGSLSLTDASMYGVQLKQFRRSSSSNNNNNKSKLEGYEDLAFALTSPAGLFSLGWMVTSFLAVLYGSSIIVYLSFCCPLIYGPYIVNEQMRVQYLPSFQKRTKKLRKEANSLAMENVQLKGTVNKLQRQEYRLSAVEERFEHLCKRDDKDVMKMKRLAKKFASDQQTIKKKIAANKIQARVTNMLRADRDGNCLVNEKEIEEAVSQMRVFAGRNAPKFDEVVICKVFQQSLLKNHNKKVTLIQSSSDTRLSQREEVEEEAQTRATTENSIASSHQLVSKMIPNTEETWTVSSNNDPYCKLSPNGLLLEKRNSNEDAAGGIKSSMSNGTVDSPIDIETLLSYSPKIDRRYSTPSE